jgi:hypothetical protein
MLGVGLALLEQVFAVLDGARVAAVITGSALACVALVAPSIRTWLPERPCQVSRKHMLRPQAQAAAIWGLQLGTGVTTFVVTPALYALIVAAAAQSDPMASWFLAALYGTCRGAVIAIFALRYARAPRQREDRLLGIGLEARLRPALMIAVASTAALTLI